jgi:hypothetical protein
MLARACTYFIPDLSFNEDMGIIVRDVAARVKAVQKAR